MEDRILAMALFQLVVRDLRAEVVDMVKADITREPLQDFRQFIEGAALHTCREEIPIGMTLPVARGKVMLNIEQPDTGRSSDQQNGKLDQQEGPPADRQHDQADERGQSNVRPDDAAALPSARM